MNKILNFAARHPRLLIISGAVLFAAILFAQFGFAHVNVEGADNSALHIELFTNSSKDSLKPGFTWHRTGTYSVRASTASQATEQTIQFKPFRITTVNIKLENQQSIQKIAGNTLGCVFGAKDSETTTVAYSYTCDGRTKLFSHSFTTDKPVKGELRPDYVYNATPYLNGVLVFVNKPGGVETGLDYVTPTNRFSTSFGTILGSDISGLTVQVFSNGSFVIHNSTAGKLTLYKSVQDKSPQTLDLPAKKGSNTAEYIIATHENILYVATQESKPITTATQPSDSDRVHYENVELQTYDISSGQFTPKNTVTVDASESLLGLQVVTSDTIAAFPVGGTIKLYKTTGNKLEYESSITDAVRYVVKDGKIIFQRNKDLYSYDPAEQISRLMYRFESLIPTSLQLVQDDLFVGATLASKSFFFNFKIVPASPASNLIRTLSYPDTMNEVSYVDYNKSVIYAALNLQTITSNRSTGRVSFDPVEISKNKNTLLEKLRRDSIELTAYRIVTDP